MLGSSPARLRSALRNGTGGSQPRTQRNHLARLAADSLDLMSAGSESVPNPAPSPVRASSPSSNSSGSDSYAEFSTDSESDGSETGSESDGSGKGSESDGSEMDGESDGCETDGSGLESGTTVSR